ncbi:cytochrome b5 [Cylindrobasidium torrendii FP15055 ss-10]|uniref:Cytochrome b5 n=1 Tax=Cylindrobasidium torrendii FP15055 ss-10 TaxID=1314674 RepID=A0A0D7BFT2_9AGAR|nr:cytochrome b5 [Cylindrobasidium torrendii FP15055 ss-10]
MSKLITYEELKAHSNKDDLYMLFDGKVYDCTKFLDEHPGGDEVIIAEAGRDATEAFEDVGHSDEARAMLVDLLVGDFDKDSGLNMKSGSGSAQASRMAGAAVEQTSNLMYFVPLMALGAYFAWRYYTTGSV